MPSIVALINGSPHAWIVIHAVVGPFGPITVLTEDKEPRWELARRRLKRHGPFTWAGQLGFVFLQRLIARRSRTRFAEIIAEHGRTREAIRDAPGGELRPFRPGLPSQLLYHPTLWSYMRTGLTSGICWLHGRWRGPS